MSEREKPKHIEAIHSAGPTRPAAASTSSSGGASAHESRATDGNRQSSPAGKASEARDTAQAPSSPPRPQRGSDVFRQSADLAEERGGGGDRRGHVSAILHANKVAPQRSTALEMPRGMSQDARDRAAAWYDKQTEKDKSFYRAYLDQTPPAERSKTLELMQKIDATNVHDQQQRNQLRTLFLNGGRHMTKREIGYLKEVVLTDEASKAKALKGEHLVGEGGQSRAEVRNEVAAYNTDNRKLMFSTDLLDKTRGQQKEVMTHELTHPAVQMQLEDQKNPKKDRDMVYGLQMRQSMRHVAGTPAERRQTLGVLADMYQRRGYNAGEARDKAQHALSDPNEYIASYRSLFLGGDESATHRLAALDPGMARLLRAEAAGQVPTDKAYLANLNLRDFERDFGMRQGSMRRFEGFETDPKRRAELEQYLQRQSDFRLDGTLGSGTAVEDPTQSGSSHRDVHGGASGATSPSSDSRAYNGRSAPGTVGSPADVLTTTSGAYGSSSSSSVASSYTSSFGTYNLAQAFAPADPPQAPLTPPLDPSLADLPVMANMVDLNRDGAIDARDQQIYNQIMQTSPNADMIGADPEKLLGSVLHGVAEGRGDAFPAAAPPPFTEDTPEMRLMRQDNELAGAATPEAGATAPARTPPVRTLNRQDLEQLVGQVHTNIQGGFITPSEVNALAVASYQPDGATRAADVLEATVTGQGGPNKMMALMHTASSHPEAARAMAHTLANVAEAVPARAVGTLLLTTDAAGGADALTHLFASMTADPQGAVQMGRFFEAATRHPDAARGMGELLDTLTEPREGSRVGSQQVAKSLAESTGWVSGARGITQGFTNMLENDGGSRAFARLMHRFTGTADGTRSTGQMLRRMSFDTEGTQAVSQLLSRASVSRDGARQMLDSLHRIAASESGKRDVSVVLERISSQPTGARFVANVTANDGNAEAFAGLLDRLGESDGARARVGRALENVTHVGAASDLGRIVSRAKTNEALKTTLEQLDWKPPVSESAALPLAPEGLEAQARVADQIPLTSSQTATPTPGTTAQPTPAAVATSRGPASQTGRADRTAPRIDAASGLRSDEGPAASPSRLDAEPRQLMGFRPADVYAEDTLRKARICPDCGFRLSAGGTCLRCVAFEQRGTSPPLVARIQDA